MGLDVVQRGSGSRKSVSVGCSRNFAECGSRVQEPRELQAGCGNHGSCRQGVGTMEAGGRVQGPWKLQAGYRNQGSCRQGTGTKGAAGRVQEPMELQVGCWNLGSCRQGTGTNGAAGRVLEPRELQAGCWNHRSHKRSAVRVEQERIQSGRKEPGADQTATKI